ncbi:ion channel [Paludisphaera rhizosphaerae]|uniref:ion channel n=1 Tax=Paludisphaera rhizosphaerae TaxID=2711216 RepID=UPI0013ED9AD1|nr:ion channel [Paludisphaera rhizosphaerae]
MLSSALVALVVLPGSIVIQAIAIAVTVRFVAWLLSVGYAGRSFWRNVSVSAGVMVILLVALLMQVGEWALAFVLCGALPDFATAFYHSAVNFTTLGYGDIVMAAGWRLLGPLEAANGVLMFGLSASAMFAVTSRLLDLRLMGPHEAALLERSHPPRNP